MTTLVTLRNITKTYQRGPEQVQVLHGIDLDIPRGDFVALMGPSGSGKTTLLNLIGGLDTPSGGEIEIEGERIDRLSAGLGRFARQPGHAVVGAARGVPLRAQGLQAGLRGVRVGQHQGPAGRHVNGRQRLSQAGKL